MILKGSQRAGASQLARHLSNLVDNDHVEVHALRGFVADTLLGALNEAYAVSRGTRCRQFLFSLSLNPPEKERVALEIFEGAIDAIEAKLGLSGQPRALIFHEKDGRRHAHVVWSRIDPVRMKAVNLPHYKLKLRDMSRQLYLENDWKMPRGLMNSAERNPLNFTLAEWQQARRANTDPRVIKGALQDCWAVSDSKAAFANALAARGFYLARGDRRGHVVIDWRGDVFAVSRWVGVRAKDVRAKLGEPDELPSVEEVRRQTAARFGEKLKAFIGEVTARHEKAAGALEKRKRQLVADQRKARQQLRQFQHERQIEEIKARSEKLPKGVKALWYRVTGRWRKITQAIEAEFQACESRDRRERQSLISTQLGERRRLQQDIRQHKDWEAVTRQQLDRDMADYLSMAPDEQEKALTPTREVGPIPRRTREGPER